MLRFRLGPFPVGINPIFFLVAGLLGYPLMREPLKLVAWMAVVFVSVLWHELGHAVAFRAFGRDAQIELFGMGGVTKSRGRELRPWQQVLISLAGPFAGIGLGVAVLAISSVTVGPQLGGALLPAVVGFLLWVNIGWAVLNLLPILPLDGGQVVRHGLKQVGVSSADRIAHGLSVATAGAGLVLAISAGMIWAAFLCGLFAWSNVQALMVPDDRSSDLG